MGSHTIEVHAMDTTQMPAMTSITVTQGPPCTAAAGCEGTDVCVDGGCIPGPDAPGGLGAICQSGDQCLSLQCATRRRARSCTAWLACDPSSAAQLPERLRVPAEPARTACAGRASGGCCSASGDPRASLLLGAFVLGLVLRRRRRDDGMMKARDYAIAIVTGDDARGQARAAARPSSSSTMPEPELRLAAPGRPAELAIVPGRHARVPPLAGMRDPAQRARILHALANHELQAIELFAWAVLAYPDAPLRVPPRPRRDPRRRAAPPRSSTSIGSPRSATRSAIIP